MSLTLWFHKKWKFMVITWKYFSDRAHNPDFWNNIQNFPGRPPSILAADTLKNELLKNFSRPPIFSKLDPMKRKIYCKKWQNFEQVRKLLNWEISDLSRVGHTKILISLIYRIWEEYAPRHFLVQCFRFFTCILLYRVAQTPISSFDLVFRSSLCKQRLFMLWWT